MNLQQLSALENLRSIAPMPWIMEQNNDSGIVIKDNHGKIIHDVDFGGIPDEWPSHLREEEVARQRALAHYLIVMSGSPIFA